MTCPLTIKTPATDPNHQVVGNFFRGYSYAAKGLALYYCDAWVENYGFWMTNVQDPSDRKNISERAIGRAFYKVYEDERDYAICTAAFAKNVQPILAKLDPLAGSRYEGRAG